jgi:hypothetical protein
MLTLFSVAGNFRWNAVLSAVSRLFIYGSVAAALPRLRKRYPQGGTFRLRAGNVFVAFALLFTGVLASQMHRSELVALAITFSVGAINWLWARRRVVDPN